MRELLNTEETVRFCKALSSPLRVEMLQYILAHEETSPNDLAEAFGVSRAAVTQNLRLLTEAGGIPGWRCRRWFHLVFRGGFWEDSAS